MATPTRPKKVPADAVWNESENEWEPRAKKSGRETGVWSWWRPDGKLVCRSHYDGAPGKLHGPFQRFHPNGEVCLEGTYQDGKPVGLHTWQFSSARSDQPFYFENILSVGKGVKKVVVDCKKGAGFTLQLVEAVLQGARHSKALRPVVKAVTARTDVPNGLKTLAAEVLKG